MEHSKSFLPLRVKISPARLDHAVWVFANDVVHLPDTSLDASGCAFVQIEGSNRLGVYCKRALIAVRLFAPERISKTALNSAGEISHSAFVSLAVGWFQALSSQKRDLIGAHKPDAMGAQKVLAPSHSEAFRLVHGDADGLAGLVVDDYGPLVVVQSGSAHVDFLMPLWTEALLASTDRPLFERSSGQVRRAEQLPERTRWLRSETGVHAEGQGGTQPGVQVEVFFAGLNLTFVPERSQKTGLFLDQRTNLNRLRDLLQKRSSGNARNRFLDLCSYAGAWSCVGAQAGFRHFTLVDQDTSALQLAAKNIGLNKKISLGADKSVDLNPNSPVEIEARVGDVFEQLALLKRENRAYDVVVADPPAFAKSKQHVLEAKRAYARLAKGAAGLLAEGGILVLCSCSRNLTEDDFTAVLAHALGREWVVLARGDQAVCHTLPLLDAGSRYLKCFFLERRAGPHLGAALCN